MNKTINPEVLKQNVEALAAQEGMTVLDTISYLQRGAAEIENAELMDALCNLKWAYVE